LPGEHAALPQVSLDAWMRKNASIGTIPNGSINPAQFVEHDGAASPATNDAIGRSTDRQSIPAESVRLF
jgi:hypothetical protein